MRYQIGSDELSSLRSVLDEQHVVVAPGVADPLSARLVERHGFPAVYITGHGVSALRYGLPDAGLVGRAEMAEAVATIARSTALPVISDADTGYGGLVSVRQTVRDFERAGASALHLEDQQLPKRCGYVADAPLVQPDEMAARITAAIRARRSEEFLVIARTEARLARDLDETVARAKRYRDAGADLLFVNAPPDADAVADLPRRIDAPLVHNNAGTPGCTMLSPAQAGELGYRVLLYPTQLARAAVAGVAGLLPSLRQDAPPAADERVLDFASWLELTGMGDAEAFETSCARESRPWRSADAPF